jgi:hypothetical protein
MRKIGLNIKGRLEFCNFSHKNLDKVNFLCKLL